MRKTLLWTAVSLFLLVIVVIAVLALTLNSTLKHGIETVGSRLTQVEVKLNNANLSLLSGTGKLEGLVIGNPPNYKSPNAIQVAGASVSVSPGSLLSGKVLVKSVRVENPEINFETGLQGNNLKKILANLEASAGAGRSSADKPASTGSSRKLQVDNFLITGGKLHVSASAVGRSFSADIAMPEIHLQDLGKGPDGITSAELAQRIIQAISEMAATAVAGIGSDLLNGKLDLGKGLGITNLGNAEKITKSLDKLLKPRK